MLTNVARGRGALEIAIGEGLEALAVGSRSFQIGGYSNVADCARERYGIPASTAVKLMRFAREFRKRPLLRDAVRAGAVSVSQAEAVLPVAVGDGERLWVARARSWTVRRLDEEVRRLRDGAGEAGTDESLDGDAEFDSAPASRETADVRTSLSEVDATAAAREVDERDDRWTCLVFDVPGGQEIIDEGMALARRALENPGAPKWQVLQWVAAEYRNGGDEVAEESSVALPPSPESREIRTDAGSLEVLGEALDQHCAYWAALVQVPDIAAPEVNAELMQDARLIDAQIRRHVGMLRRWDVLFG